MRTRLAATLRRCGGVLVAADGWEGAQARLLVARQEWAGIGTVHRHLHPPGAAARLRTEWLWLPGPDGSVGAVDQITASGQDMRDTG